MWALHLTTSVLVRERQREAGSRRGETQTHRGQGNVKMAAEVRVMSPQAKECEGKVATTST